MVWINLDDKVHLHLSLFTNIEGSINLLVEYSRWLYSVVCWKMLTIGFLYGTALICGIFPISIV